MRCYMSDDEIILNGFLFYKSINFEEENNKNNPFGFLQKKMN
jgi:hypothetical protein